jgi:hypothetical protein
MPFSKLTRKILLTESISLKRHLISQRPCWMHEVNMLRNTQGELMMLYKQVRKHEDKFAEYLRMSIKSLTFFSKLVFHFFFFQKVEGT